MHLNRQSKAAQVVVSTEGGEVSLGGWKKSGVDSLPRLYSWALIGIGDPINAVEAGAFTQGWQNGSRTTCSVTCSIA